MSVESFSSLLKTGTKNAHSLAGKGDSVTLRFSNSISVRSNTPIPSTLKQMGNSRGRSVLICNFQTRFCLNGMDFIAAVIYPDDSNLIVYTFDYVTVLVKRRNDFRKCLTNLPIIKVKHSRLLLGTHNKVAIIYLFVVQTVESSESLKSAKQY
ncbi:uncharacterized protein LOC111264125 isoform X2 [Varroa jacobsoni]|uniref:uncharacterized protein LOC111264125 isoform X2 n=1 Tax=Varroa jacobsoni TaxID=62625 RepID=UPI000BFA8A00|nr:uncharacterized protein LOC111264125 isoform X2 [Varroa jacobsoni]